MQTRFYFVVWRKNKHQSQDLFRECLARQRVTTSTLFHYRDTCINDRETREDKDIEADEDLITREHYLLMTTKVWRERNADRTAWDSDLLWGIR